MRNSFDAVSDDLPNFLNRADRGAFLLRLSRLSAEEILELLECAEVENPLVTSLSAKAREQYLARLSAMTSGERAIYAACDLGEFYNLARALAHPL